MSTPVDPRTRPLKRAEIAIRQWLTRRLQGSTPPVKIERVQDALALPDAVRILFLRQDRIGDVLIATPIVHAVRQQLPNATIDMLLSTNNAAVRRTVESVVDHILVYGRTLGALFSMIREIRAKRYDVVVDLLDNPSATSTIFVRFSGAPVRIGIDKENRNVYTHVVPLLDRTRYHVSDRIAHVMLPFGVVPDQVDMRPRYPVTEEEQAQARLDLGVNPDLPAVAVVLSGSLATRRLGADKTVRVLSRVMSVYPSVQFFVFGTPQEQDQVRAIAEATGAHAVPPSDGFHSYATRLRVMQALWTPDTAATHLAAAWQTPVCGMYIRDVDQRYPWYPYRTHVEAVFSPTDDLADTSETEIVNGIERLFAYCGFERAE